MSQTDQDIAYSTAIQPSIGLKNFSVWSSNNAFVSGAGGLRIKSRAGQIGHSVANGSPPLQHFKKSCVARAQ